MPQLENGIVGVLDNISKPKVGRYILIQKHGTLGCKRGTCNLLDLGVRFRLRGLVAHELSHGVLENQWRGCDPSCGRVMLRPGHRLDNQPYELFLRQMLLALFGWTMLAHYVTVPIVPNEERRKSPNRQRRQPSWWWWRPLKKQLHTTVSIYMIPCIKHQVAIASHIARLVVLIEFSLQNPYNPLNGIDLVLALFIASTVLQECVQARAIGLIQCAATLPTSILLHDHCASSPPGDRSTPSQPLIASDCF